MSTPAEELRARARDLDRAADSDEWVAAELQFTNGHEYMALRRTVRASRAIANELREIADHLPPSREDSSCEESG